MSRSKARTDDWVKLANSAVTARDHIRAAFAAAQDMRDSDKGTLPEFRNIYVLREPMRDVLNHLANAGKILTAALKEREPHA